MQWTGSTEEQCMQASILEDCATKALCLLEKQCREERGACIRVPFSLLTCSKISCFAVTSFSNRSIFFINLLTWGGWEYKQYQ